MFYNNWEHKVVGSRVGPDWAGRPGQRARHGSSSSSCSISSCSSSVDAQRAPYWGARTGMAAGGGLPPHAAARSVQIMPSGNARPPPKPRRPNPPCQYGLPYIFEKEGLDDDDDDGHGHGHH
jgi:hypothetical protein